MCAKSPRFALLAALLALAAAQDLNIQVPMSAQINYIAQIAQVKFANLDWASNFVEAKCPEFEKQVPKPSPDCPLKSPMSALRIIPTLSRCDVNPFLQDCTDFIAAHNGVLPSVGSSVYVDCSVTPNACLQPRFCDWGGNASDAKCPSGQHTCITINSDPSCEPFDKCGLTAYSATADCTAGKKCQDTPQLCVNLCDVGGAGYEDECLVQNCGFSPTKTGCSQLSKCTPTTNCHGRDILMKPECCANNVCLLPCILDNSCPPETPNPQDACEQMYQLGMSVVEILSPAVDHGQLDIGSLKDAMACYDITWQITNASELVCFKNGVRDAFAAYDAAHP